MIRRPPRSTQGVSSAASDVYKRQTLNLSYNSIGDKVAEYIATALNSNSTLISLNLGINSIGVKGAEYIATALISNSTLTSLNLGNNSIGDKGAEYIAAALKSNSTLTTLNFFNNKMMTKQAEKLLRYSAAINGKCKVETAWGPDDKLYKSS
eukprot:TRINITY_DN4564_c0_g2_i7.p2 TRINITY_DN4564_c0_g2~~TRINITY_DN4564_c0_g2_i7.p2  ORF type:complete len:152 (-),score=30.68 TRINITY_DN4564_c0_g2_i7:30-485(-)